jgi:hypothetical protein
MLALITFVEGQGDILSMIVYHSLNFTIFVNSLLRAFIEIVLLLHEIAHRRSCGMCSTKLTAHRMSA